MHRLSAFELSHRFKSGEFSAKEITEHFLSRIAHHDQKTCAFITVLEERALKKAEELDEKRRRKEPLGLAAGVPLAIKDILNIKDEITTCGSQFLKNFRAPFSATAVDLLEKEDAIIVGKTQLDEFAMGSSTETSSYKKTKNPWKLSCSPGGSSGGSAAACAARLSLLALGTDTGGSIRQPASLCGVVGYKATYGRVSRYGAVAFASSLDHVGAFSTCCEDMALTMQIIGRHSKCDSTSVQKGPEDILATFKEPLAPMTIGVPWQFLEDLEPEYRTSFEESVKVLQSLGMKVVEVDLSILKYSIAVYYPLCAAEASTNLARFDGIRYGVRSPRATTLDEVYDFSRQEGFGPEVKRRIMLGTFVLSSGYQDAYYRKAQRARTLIIEKYKEAFKVCDLIAMPVSPFAAFESGSIKDPLQMYLADIYTIGGNLAGVPAVSIPSGFTKDMRPIGLQLIGPQLHDARVLRAAYAFQGATSFHTQIPRDFAE
jgi:aspartyl-tRNA(Asn)/glutamyl-tRNA(Gln) amidotransferase subunit A